MSTTKGTDWYTLLQPTTPWPHLYPIVAAHGRAYLQTLPEDKRISSATFVEWLWPLPDAPAERVLAKRRERAARQRLFRCLNVCAGRQLADCATHGDARFSYGKEVRPFVWSRPDPTKAHLVTNGPPVRTSSTPSRMIELEKRIAVIEAQLGLGRVSL